MKTVNFNGLEIGPGKPCVIIAEAGVNHNGCVETALRMVDAAAAAGAHAIKFQSFNAEALLIPSAPKAAYQAALTGLEESQFEMLKRLELDRSAHEQLASRARERGVIFLSSPFDEASADLLEAIGVSVFKIASGAITNLPLLEHVARKKRPVILSTGMSELEEVEAAMRVFEEAGNDRIALLHCVTSYPADPEDCNLRAMRVLENKFDVPVGFSDHTMGLETAFAAVALGACVVEKHFTLDRNQLGPDHRSSIEPNVLSALVTGARSVHAALGDGRKNIASCEREHRVAGRVSLVTRVNISAGTVLTRDMLCCKRPGCGITPAMITRVVGRTANVNIEANSLLDWSQLK